MGTPSPGGVMAEHVIPVDLYNPSQVFACLGFLEAADLLLGDAEGGFDWSDAANVAFRLGAAGDENPVAAVLEFLATARQDAGRLSITPILRRRRERAQRKKTRPTLTTRTKAMRS